MIGEHEKFFPGQAKDEKVFLLLRRHWFTYVIFWIVSLIALVPLVMLIIYWLSNIADIAPLTQTIFAVGSSIYLLSFLGLLLYGFVDYYLDIYIITDRRIVDISQNGFFHRDISELHMHQIQDVNAKVQGVFPTIFHYGDIIVQTAGETGNFTFRSIAHPYTISKKIVDLHEQHLDRAENTVDISKLKIEKTDE